MVLLLNNVAVLLIAAVTACATSPSNDDLSNYCETESQQLLEFVYSRTTTDATTASIKNDLSTIMNLTSLVVKSCGGQNFTYLRNAVLDVNKELVIQLTKGNTNSDQFSVQNLEILLIKSSRGFSSKPYNLLNVSVNINGNIFIGNYNVSGLVSVVFMSYTDIPNFFTPFNYSTMTIISAIISAVVSTQSPSDITLTDPIDFTLTHISPLNPEAFLFCMDLNTSSWGTCLLTKTTGNYSVCSCKNLTTVALISQTDPCGFDLTVQCGIDFLKQVQVNIAHDLNQETVETYLGLIMNLTRNIINSSAQTSYWNALTNVTEKLVSSLNSTSITLPTLEVQILSVGPISSRNATLVTSNATMDIDLTGILKNGGGSSTVVFMSYTNISNTLDPNYNTFSDVTTSVISVVVSATLRKTANKDLKCTFTLKHLTVVLPESILFCMYWKENAWEPEYCYITETNSSHTVCLCNRLGAVVLIMQTKPCQGYLAGPCAKNFLYQISNNTHYVLPQEIVKNYLEIIMTLTAKVTDSVSDQKYLISYGDIVLNAVEKLTSTLVRKDCPDTQISLVARNCEVEVSMICALNGSLSDVPQIGTTNTFMAIDLVEIAKENNGSAAVAFIAYSDMANLLKATFLKTNTSPTKTVLSDVVSVWIVKTANQILTSPVNFTFQHIHDFNPEGILSCVYWENGSWVDGCSIVQTNNTHTVCACNHLSTFALIMRTEPCRSDQHMNMCLAGATLAGLVFLISSLLTLAFYSRNPVTDATLINLCINLLVFYILNLIKTFSLANIHPLYLRTALLGIQWFFLMSVFVWMFIEAVLLYIFVKNLSEISSNMGEVLSWKWLIAIGYLVPLGVLGMSAVPFPTGYVDEECWPNNDNLIFIFASPVLFIVTLNLVPYVLVIVMVIANRQDLMHEVFQKKNSSDKNNLKCMICRSLAQFVVLICYWVFLYIPSKNGVLYHAFLFLNAQQGTVIFLTHCLLNTQIRQKYKKLLCAWCLPNYPESSRSVSRSVRGEAEN